MPSSRDESAARPVFRISEMRVEDLDQILATETASFPNPWTRRHFLDELRDNPLAVNRVVRTGDRVVAYVSAWQIEHEVKINTVAVDPNWRRRGIARRLLKSLIEGARRDGCRVVTLEVRESNAGARRLYRRLGFVEDGRRPGYYVYEDEDAILMSLRLEAG